MPDTTRTPELISAVKTSSKKGANWITVTFRNTATDATVANALFHGGADFSMTQSIGTPSDLDTHEVEVTVYGDYLYCQMAYYWNLTPEIQGSGIFGPLSNQVSVDYGKKGKP